MTFRPKVWHLTLGAVVLVFIGAELHEQATRYLSWRDISKKQIVAAADWYIENRAPGERACLYAVVCEQGRARLELVEDLESWDLEATKELVWDRKFGGTCPGRTANFALEMAPSNLDTHWANKRAVWSFYNDRFIPSFTRFNGGSAFSEIKAQPCSQEFAITK